MKIALKKAGILRLALLFCVGLVFTNGYITYIPTTPINPEHTLHLHSLYLGSGLNEGASRLKASSGQLDILNGLIIGTGNYRNDSTGTLIVIGGGNNNTNKGKNSGIAGGSENKINSENSAIGGGEKNIVTGNNAVIAGGNNNKAGEGGIIVGGKGGNGLGVVLGGINNKANGVNSLVMGSGAGGLEGSFARNDRGTINAVANSARIDASSGVLIGTLQPIKGVALVVSGAIKLGESSSSASAKGEIRVQNGCIRAYDGKNWHNLGGSCSGFNNGSECQFGQTFLQEGDKVTGYNAPYAENCATIKTDVTCSGGKLVPSDHSYPYCYNTPKDPRY